MSNFPGLLSTHEYRSGFETDCSCGAHGIWSWSDYIEHIREACTIRTVEQLDALPDDSIVRGAHGMPWHKDCYGWWPASASAGARAARLISLPALLIWHPDWART